MANMAKAMDSLQSTITSTTGLCQNSLLAQPLSLLETSEYAKYKASNQL